MQRSIGHAAWLERDSKKAEELFEKAADLGNTPRAARIYGVFLRSSAAA